MNCYFVIISFQNSVNKEIRHFIVVFTRLPDISWFPDTMSGWILISISLSFVFKSLVWRNRNRVVEIARRAISSLVLKKKNKTWRFAFDLATILKINWYEHLFKMFLYCFLVTPSTFFCLILTMTASFAWTKMTDLKHFCKIFHLWGTAFTV